MLPPDLQRIARIHMYCTTIEATISRYGAALDNFIADVDYQQSVAFSLLQIDELADGLSEDYRHATAGRIPWASVKGMRNLVAHDYGSVNRERMWKIALEDVPLLKKFCEEQLSESE